mmetsp:Transcript_30325/g.51667  ORF Transcript_30325/g.51667 Transcript_30325/m.51667 type:complete len:240 (-) Transcript_30325:531-1250(-)
MGDQLTVRRRRSRSGIRPGIAAAALRRSPSLALQVRPIEGFQFLRLPVQRRLLPRLARRIGAPTQRLGAGPIRPRGRIVVQLRFLDETRLQQQAVHVDQIVQVGDAGDPLDHLGSLPGPLVRLVPQQSSIEPSKLTQEHRRLVLPKLTRAQIVFHLLLPLREHSDFVSHRHQFLGIPFLFRGVGIVLGAQHRHLRLSLGQQIFEVGVRGAQAGEFVFGVGELFPQRRGIGIIGTGTALL